jgi:hypothetical protein
VQALCLRVAQIARKQRNLNYASRLLHGDAETSAAGVGVGVVAGGGAGGGGGGGAGKQGAALGSTVLQAKMESALLCLAKRQVVA